jgi:hypothetical protein
MLKRLHDEAPGDHFTLGALVGGLENRSFGAVMLLCALLAAVPGISLIAGMLLIIMAVQMIAGRPAPAFPAAIADRALPKRHLATFLQRALPMLSYVERVVHPRWPMPPNATRRVVGVAVVLLSLAVMLFPFPLANIPPAMLIALISLAYLEEDGLLLTVGLVLGAILLIAEFAALRDVILDAERWFDQ